MNPRHIAGAAFPFTLEDIKERTGGTQNVQLKQSTVRCLARGSCGLRLEMDPTLTSHLMGWRVRSERWGGGALAWETRC